MSTSKPTHNRSKTALRRGQTEVHPQPVPQRAIGMEEQELLLGPGFPDLGAPKIIEKPEPESF